MDKPASIETTVFLCGTCRNIRGSKEKADKCCLCEKCGAAASLPDYGWTIQKLCDRCNLKSGIRHAQENLRKCDAAVRSARSHLAKLQEEKRKLDKGVPDADDEAMQVARYTQGLFDDLD